MGYVLTFLGGAVFGGLCGVVTMCCCIISGEESGKEEKYLDGKNTSDGV